MTDQLGWKRGPSCLPFVSFQTWWTWSQVLESPRPPAAVVPNTERDAAPAAAAAPGVVERDGFTSVAPSLGSWSWGRSRHRKRRLGSGFWAFQDFVSKGCLLGREWSTCKPNFIGSSFAGHSQQRSVILLKRFVNVRSTI